MLFIKDRRFYCYSFTTRRTTRKQSRIHASHGRDPQRGTARGTLTNACYLHGLMPILDLRMLQHEDDYDYTATYIVASELLEELNEGYNNIIADRQS